MHKISKFVHFENGGLLEYFQNNKDINRDFVRHMYTQKMHLFDIGYMQ